MVRSGGTGLFENDTPRGNRQTRAWLNTTPEFCFAPRNRPLTLMLRNHSRSKNGVASLAYA
jgi:hypothetical protein